MVSGRVLAGRYVGFAILATLGNLAIQRLTMRLIEPPAGFYLALAAGTAAGLAIKYLLDKRWIFEDQTRGLAAQGRQFSLYTLMGVATTLIFWASETAFWLIWRTEGAREIGAVLGLSVGYAVKYRLDRRYVFAPAPAQAERPA